MLKTLRHIDFRAEFTSEFDDGTAGPAFEIDFAAESPPAVDAVSLCEQYEDRGHLSCMGEVERRELAGADWPLFGQV